MCCSTNWFCGPGRPLGLVLLLVLAIPASGNELTAEYTGDALCNAAGGLATGCRYLDKLDVALGIDSPALPGTAYGTFYARLLYTNATTFSEGLVGDLQIVSNIDAIEAWRVFEFWYEVVADRWSVKAGLFDLNSEFDVNETGELFMNSSHGIGVELGQTGRNGPGIYPVSATALRASLAFDSVTARVVVMDGVPGNPDDPSSNRIELKSEDGVLAVAELDVALSDSLRLWSGFWRYTSAFEHAFDDEVKRRNDGWYVGLEKDLVVVGRRAALFARLGHADERINIFGGYAGFGLVVDGPYAARPDDRVGVAVASGRAGRPYRDFLTTIGATPRGHETAWEITYQVPLGEHLVVQPNIQYVQNPSASGSIDNAWVIAIRFQWLRSLLGDS